MKKISILLIGISCSLSVISAKTQSEIIIDHINNKRWSQASKELSGYRQTNPDKKWAWSTHGWVYENLKEYDNAISVTEEGLAKWPGDEKLKNALARALAAKALGSEDTEAHILLLKAAELSDKPYISHRLAKSYRKLGNFAKTIEILEQGMQQHPDYEYFKQSLPYTRYLYFKDIKKSGDPSELKKIIETAKTWLEDNKPLYRQMQYLYIFRFGLRELNDQDYLDKTYLSLIERFKDDALIYDEYGFQMYAAFRMHNPFKKDIRKKAISSRRKAYNLYWQKNKKPAPLKNMNYPMKGRYQIWSNFGGRAMTHNGFAHYCYDFAAVDEQDNIYKPGTQGKALKDYYMWSLPVYAVADGKVISANDNYPDNKPGGYAALANTVEVSHGSYETLYAHFKMGGVVVKKDQQVKAGDLLGYIGNSGMSSQPHLHFCTYTSEKQRITIPYHFKKARVKNKNATGFNFSTKPYNEFDVVIFK